MPQFCIPFYAKYAILAPKGGAMAQCPPLNVPLTLQKKIFTSVSLLVNWLPDDTSHEVTRERSKSFARFRDWFIAAIFHPISSFVF